MDNNINNNGDNDYDENEDDVSKKKVFWLFRNKRRLITLFAVILILIGAAVVLYPYARAQYFNYLQSKLMDAWTASDKNTNPVIESIPEPATNAIINDDGIFEEDVNAVFDLNYALRLMVGVLEIPSIEIKSPILVGDTKENLDIAVCEVAGSCKLGEVGNYILAGHYSKIRGRHFNRLPEIKIGAQVFISTATERYEYDVYEILHVKAEDTWAVPLNPKEHMATLITCDYSVYPYGRVIVRCLLKSSDNVAGESE